MKTCNIEKNIERLQESTLIVMICCNLVQGWTSSLLARCLIHTVRDEDLIEICTNKYVHYVTGSAIMIRHMLACMDYRSGYCEIADKRPMEGAGQMVATSYMFLTRAQVVASTYPILRSLERMISILCKSNLKHTLIGYLL